MLEIIRRRKNSPVVKALLIGIAVTFFGGFGILGYCTKQQQAEQLERDKLATVNGTIITRTQVDRLANNKRERMKGAMSEAEWEKAREDTLNSLINQELVYQEAARLGISVSDEDVQSEISNTFQVEGAFQPDLYRNFLSRQGFTEESFNQELRRELIIRKMMQIIGGTAIVTEADLTQQYRYENEQADIELIVVDPEAITDVAQPTTAEVKAKFDSNEEGYIVPEKRKIKYVCYDAMKMASSLNITDADIQAFYDKAKNSKFAETPRKVKVEQIFFKVDSTASEEDRNKIKEKAQQVVSDARLGTSTFENLASLYSDDIETKSKGGDLGWFNVGTKPGPIEKAIEKMKPGDISDLVEAPDGYYIYKLVEETPGKYKSLASVRGEIIAAISKQRGFEMTHQSGKKLLDAVREGSPFEMAAKAVTAEVHISDFFEQTAADINKLPDSQKLVQAAFELWDENQVSDAVDLETGDCVVQLFKIDESHEATFEEAIPIITNEILAIERKDKAKQIADDLLKKIEGGMSFEEAAKQPGAKLMTTGYFARGRGQIPNVGFSEDIITAAFSVPPHDPVVKQIFQVGGKNYLVKLMGRKQAELAGFEKEKSMLKMKLTFKRQQELTDSWIESLKARAKIDRRQIVEPEQPK